MLSFEKRHFIRARADFQVAVEILGRSEEHYPARVSDISLDGVYLFSDTEFALASKQVLYFPEEWGSICAIAKVVRRIDNNYGCQFLAYSLLQVKKLTQQFIVTGGITYIADFQGNYSQRLTNRVPCSCELQGTLFVSRKLAWETRRRVTILIVEVVK